MIRRLLAAYQTWDRGFLLPRLLHAARRPTDLEPPPAPTVLLPSVLDPGAGTGPTAVVPAADSQPTAPPSTSDRPQVTMEREHEGADDTEFPALLAGMRHDLEHDGGSLDPAERERERIEREWEEAFARLEGLLDLEARRSERRLDARLEAFAPGWDSQVCDPAFVGRSHCGRCVPDFDGVRELAGVIVLGAEPVDWATGEWPVLEVAG